MTAFGMIVEYSQWLGATGLEETNYIIQRPFAQFLNNNCFVSHEIKAMYVEQFAKRYDINIRLKKR